MNLRGSSMFTCIRIYQPTGLQTAFMGQGRKPDQIGLETIKASPY